jgi:hypothetical protein
MDLKKLRRGELSAGGAAIVLIIVSVMPPIPLAFEVERGPLLYAGAVLCAAMTFGGWLHVQSRNTAGFDNRNATPPPM